MKGGFPPPSTKKKFSAAALITFDVNYHNVNDIVSPAQAKIFINCVMKGQNQALGMILHITIKKNLPRDKKGGGV